MAVWSKIRHKHVLRLLGYILESDGRISIVTPWQHNGTAREFLRGKSWRNKKNVVSVSTAPDAFVNDVELSR
jgi:hypothetical protein